MSVSLSEVIRAARARRASLAGESAGYLVLAVADQVLGAPRAVQAADVELSHDGGLRLLSGAASSAEQAEHSLRVLLDELLSVASSGNPSLLRASRRSAQAGLQGLVRELEAALIPANRAAARRALSRLQRETARAKDEQALAPEQEKAAHQPAPAAPELARAPSVELASEPALALSPVAVPAVSESALVLSPVAVPAVSESALVLSPGAVPAVSELPQQTAAIAVAEQHPIEAECEESPTRALVVSAGFQELEVDVDLCDLLTEDESPIEESPTRALPLAVLVTEEVCTRPEPVVLRASQRPPAAPPEAITETNLEPVEFEAFTPAACLPRTLTPTPAPLELPALESLTPTPAPLELPALESLTPALGTLAGELPVLSEDTLDELSAEEIALRLGGQACAQAAANLECSEPVPEVAPLSPGESILPKRQSELSDLVAGFSVAGEDSSAELCRAVKEMAGLELTPAPFAALIR